MHFYFSMLMMWHHPRLGLWQRFAHGRHWKLCLRLYPIISLHWALAKSLTPLFTADQHLCFQWLTEVLFNLLSLSYIENIFAAFESCISSQLYCSVLSYIFSPWIDWTIAYRLGSTSNQSYWWDRLRQCFRSKFYMSGSHALSRSLSPDGLFGDC